MRKLSPLQKQIVDRMREGWELKWSVVGAWLQDPKSASRTAEVHISSARSLRRRGAFVQVSTSGNVVTLRLAEGV